MKEILKYLKESGLQYMATTGLDGKPKVRPFQMMFEENGKIWYCTGNQKEVYKELMAHPYVEFCASETKGMSWMRLSAQVHFVNDITIKEKVLAHSTLVRNIYKTAENPVLEVFYLKQMSAVIAEIGKTPHIITL